MTQQEAEERKAAEKKAPEKKAPEKEEAPDAAEAKAAEGAAEGTEGADAPESAEEPVFTFTREQVEQMELAVKQLESVKDQFVRLTAEYDNYRKRTAREKESLYQDAKADTIQAFLAVYDDLERAAGQPGDADSPHKKGLDMIFQKYRDTLQKLGVREIDAKGKAFDPEKHNAVMHIEDKAFGENEVAQVFQAGFQLGDKVIRHAAVQVAN